MERDQSYEGKQVVNMVVDEFLYLYVLFICYFIVAVMTVVVEIVAELVKS